MKDGVRGGRLWKIGAWTIRVSRHPYCKDYDGAGEHVVGVQLHTRRFSVSVLKFPPPPPCQWMLVCDESEGRND